MTSEALDGQLQSCYAARARPKMSDGREMFLDYAWTELESYSTKYQCSESSRRQEQSIGKRVLSCMWSGWVLGLSWRSVQRKEHAEYGNVWKTVCARSDSSLNLMRSQLH